MTAAAENISVAFNEGTEGDAVIDYAAAPLEVATGPDSSLTLSFDGALGSLARASGEWELEVGEFFSTTGAFGLVQATETVTLSDESTLAVDLLSLAVSATSAFVGLHGDTAEAVGLAAAGIQLGLVVATSRNDAARNYSVLQVKGESGSLLGFDGLTLSVSDLEVLVTDGDADGRTLDFSENPLSIPLGTGEFIVNVDGAMGEVTEARFYAEADMFGFASIEGSAALRKSTLSMTLANEEVVTADALMIGAVGLNGFVGMNGGTTDAVGFAADGVEFGLLLAVDSQDETRRWTAVSAQAENVGFVGVSEIQAIGNDLSFEITRGSDGVSPIDFETSDIRIPTGPSTDRLLDIDAGATFVTRASGHLEMAVGGFVRLSGNLAFEAIDRDEVTLADGSKVDLEQLAFGGSDLQGFVGNQAGTANATGFSLVDGEFALLISNDRDDLSRQWIALQANAGSAEAVGIPEITARGSDLSVTLIDGPTEATAIDFEASPQQVPTGPSSSITFDIPGEAGNVARASGDLTLNIANFFEAEASFGIEQTRSQISLSDDSTINADLLSMAVVVDSAFLGVNAGSDNATGFNVEGVVLGLVVATDRDNPTRDYIVLQATGTQASFVGIEGMTISASEIAAEIAIGDEAGKVIDFADAPHSISAGSQTVTLDFDGSQGEVTEASLSVSADLFDFAQFTGQMAVRKSVNEVTLIDGEIVQTDWLSFGATEMSGFVGLNGGTDQAQGLTAEEVELGLLIATEQDDPARTWTAFTANVGTAAFVGSDAFAASGENLQVDLTRATGDAKQIDLANHPITIPTGTVESLVLDTDTSNGPVTRASGSLDAKVGDFFTASGNFAFEKSTREFTLSNQTIVNADVLLVGASDLQAFVGHQAGSDDRMGFAIDELDFGVLIASDQASPGRQWTALKGSAGNAGLVGVPELTASASQAVVEVNLASGTNHVIDFAAQPLEIPTGGQPVELDMSGEQGQYTAVGARLEIGLSDFASAEGDIYASFASQTNGSITEQKLTFTGENINVFVGSGEDSADEVGVRIRDTSLALVAYQTIDSTQSSQPDPTFAFSASGAAALVGIEGLTLSGTLTARANYTGEAVNEQVPTLDGSIPLEFETGDELTEVYGNVLLQFAGFVDVTGDFYVTKQTSGNVTTLSVQATGVSAFLGTGRDTEEVADDMGVELIDGAIDLRMVYDADTDESTYAVAARGQAALIGVAGVVATGSLNLERNTGTEFVELGFGTESTEDDVSLEPGVKRLFGDVAIDFAGFATVVGAFGFEIEDSEEQTKLKIAAAGVTAFVGAGDVGVEVYSANFAAIVYAQADAETTYALIASGAAGLVGVPDLTLAGQLELEINNTGRVIDETLQVPGGEVHVDFPTADDVQRVRGSATLSVAGFVDLNGNFLFEKTASGDTTNITASVNDVDVFLGVNRGQADAFGVQVEGAQLGILIEQVAGEDAKFALQSSSGMVSLIGISQLDLSGQVSVEINRLGRAIDIVIPTFDGDGIPLKFDSANDVERFGGQLTLGIAGFTELSGAFGFEREVSGDETKLKIAATAVTAFLGANPDGVSNNGDETGVSVRDAQLGVVIYQTNDGSTYALQASGAGELVGVPGLTLSGSLGVRVNRTGQVVDETVATPAGDVHVLFESAEDVTQFSGTASLAISDFVEVSGAFGFEKSEIEVNGVTMTRLAVAASEVGAFLGTGAGSGNPLGVAFSDGTLGLIIDKPASGDSTYALIASGGAALVGVPALTMSGSLGVRVNRMGRAVDETISTPAGDLRVLFETADDVTQFGGTARLAIAGFIDIEGSFGFEKVDDRILAGVSDVKAFLGANGGTPGAIGLQVTGAELGLVLEDGNYALSAAGAVGLVGLEGLSINGTFSVKANTLGVPVNETIVTPTGAVNVLFTTGEEVLSFGGSATLSVAGVFELSGSIVATKLGSGVVLVDVPNMSLMLNVNGTQIFDVGGKARFSIGGTDGFQMLDIGLTRLSVFGLDISAIAGVLPSLALPSSIPQPAELATIVDGVESALLNRRKYLDVTFQSPGEGPLDIASILDAGAEFVLSGAGVADAIVDSVEHLEGNTFRYRLRDKDPTNDIDLFRSGPVNILFAAGSWADESGVTNAATSDSFSVRDGSASTSKAVSLGPLSLQGPYFGLEDFQFKPLRDATGALLGARITITVGLGVDLAELNFGSSSSAVSTSVEGLLGLFDVNVDMSPSLQIIGGGLGKFRIEADSVGLVVSNILEASANGIVVQFDPEKDKDNDGVVSAQEEAAYQNQEIVRINDASVTITKLNISGALRPYTRRDGTTIPGISVRNNGFHLGEAELSYNDSLSFGGILQLDDIRAGVTDFGVVFGQGVAFNGEVYIASGGAELFPGKTFSMKFEDGPDADTEAVRAGIAFKNGVPSGFKFNSDQMSMKFGEFLTIGGSQIIIDTTAVGSEYVVSVGSISAEVKAGPLKIGGAMKQFAITADGRFVTNPGFGVQLRLDEASPGAFQWPSWMPIRVTKLGISWRDIQNAPADFALTMSARVTGIPGVPLTFEGAVEGLTIDLGLLQRGQFPITELESISVKVGGNFGGAEISGALIGGILKIDSAGNLIDSFDSQTAVADRVLFIGLEGKLVISNKGFQVRFAFSELGPLGVLISVKAPIVVEPVFTGLTIDEMTGSIEFFSALPTITEPDQLRDKAFNDVTEVDSETWLANVKQQVVNQVRAVKANPNVPGFLAAFTSPMTLAGAATISSTHLGSAENFNGQVQLRLSTDGKMFAAGKFRFMNNRLVVSAKMYADLAQITKGNARVLFLGEAPIIEDAPDLRFLAVKGKMEMRFIGPGGEVMDFGRQTSSTPLANLVNPGSGSVIGAQQLNQQGYLDVAFVDGAKPLDVDTVLDEGAELYLRSPDGSVIVLEGRPELITSATAGNTFRYRLPSGFVFQPGEYEVEFVNGSFADTDGTLNIGELESFTVAEVQAHLASPMNQTRVDLRAFNATDYLIVRFATLPGALLDLASIMDSDPEFVLSGVAAQGVVFDRQPEQIDAYTFRYPYSGSFGTGPVTINFLADGFRDQQGNQSVASTESFTLDGPTADLLSSASDIQVLNAAGYIDVYFSPSRSGTLDVASIIDEAAEFTVSGTAAQHVVFNGSPQPLGDGRTYRYYFSGEFTTGDVQFQFLDGAWSDSNLLTSVAESEAFSVLGATAQLVSPQPGVTGVSALNARGYIDVQFSPTIGRSLDLSSIMDSSPEFILLGAAADGVNVSGTPEQIDDFTFRYTFTGEFQPGNFEILFLEGAVADDDSVGLTSSTHSVTLRELASEMFWPLHQVNVGRNELNHKGYIEVTFDDAFGVGIDRASLEDTAQEIELFQLNDEGEEVPVPGIGVNGIAEYVDGRTWRYRFSGRFELGQVFVRFLDNTWTDNAGNSNVEVVQTFNVVQNAASFELIFQGETTLYAAVESLQLLSVKGEAKLSLDVQSDEGRIQLDLNGRADVIYLGAIGAVSGRFIFEARANQVPGIWGVMKLDTNFEKLRPLGIDADLTAMLQINLTSEQQIETLTLPGQAPGGEDLTETYILAPYLFAIEAAGRLSLHVPDFNEDDEFGVDLFRVSGAFSMEISTNGLEVFAKGDVEIGPRELDLFDLSAVGVIKISDEGFATDLVVTAEAGLEGIATLDGQFRLAVNSSGLDQQVRVSQRFIDENYLPQDFVDSLVPCDDVEDRLCYVVPAGPPRLDGTFGPAGIYAVLQGQGEVRLVDTFVIEGAFRIEVSHQGLFAQADGGLDFSIFGRVAALGYFEITAGGMLAAMSLDISTPLLAAVGVDFNVDAQMVINTYPETRTITFLSDSINAEPIVAPPESAHIEAAGELVVRVPGTDLEVVELSGVFVMHIDATGLAVFANGVIPLPGLNAPMLTMEATGAFVINAQGVAADIDATVRATGGSVFEDFFAFHVSARALFNTTSAHQEVKVPERFNKYLSDAALARLRPSSDGTGQAYVIDAGAPNLDGTFEDPAPYLVFMLDGGVTLASLFEVTGQFRMVITETRFQVDILGILSLEPLGNVVASGSLLVTSEGVYGALIVDGRFGLGPVQIYGDMKLELNSTPSDQTIQLFDSQSQQYDYHLRASSFLVYVSGTMEIAGFKMRGHFELRNNPDVISISASAEMQAFDALYLGVHANFSVVKGANPGIVINVGASLSAGFFGIDGIFDASMNFQLLMNTRSAGAPDQYDLGVQRGLTRIAANGELRLLSVLTLQGGGYIEVDNGVFRMQANMGANFFGLAHMSAHGFVSSEGEFEFAFSGGFTLGVPGFLGIQAGGSIYISMLDNNGTEPFGDGNKQLNVSGGLSGQFWIFGFSLGASVSVNYSSSTGLLSVTPRFYLNFFFFQIEISATFNIGFMKVNPPIYVAGNADDVVGTSFRGGELHLNMGDRARFRNFDLNVVNEHFAIEYIGVDAQYGGHIVRVAGNNTKQTFRGVTSIVADGGSGRDFIETDENISFPVTLRGGSQRDRIIHRGSGPAIIDGGSGDDELIGGSGDNHFVFYDGFGNDQISTLGGRSILDYSNLRSNLTTNVGSSDLVVRSASALRVNSGTARIRLPDDGNPVTPLEFVDVELVHDGARQLAILQPGHTYQVGDEIELESDDIGFDSALQRQSKWRIAEVNEFGFLIDLPIDQVGRGALANAAWRNAQGATVQRRNVNILHDGVNTATVYDFAHGVKIGDTVNLDSDDSFSYTGDFVITAVTEHSYSFALPFDTIGDILHTSMNAAEIRLGFGDDLVITSGSVSRSITIADNSGGIDELVVSGGLPSAVTLQADRFQANNLILQSLAGFDRLSLFDAGQAIQINSQGSSVDLNDMGLRVTADSIDINTAINASHIVLESRETLDVDHAINAQFDGFIDLRVFGDDADLLINDSLTVSSGQSTDGLGAGWIRLVAPDGSISGNEFVAPNSHLIYKAKNAPSETLQTEITALTFAYADHGLAGDVSIHEVDDLVLTQVDSYAHPFQPLLEFGDATFAGVLWPLATGEAWLKHVRDGEDTDAIIVPQGHLAIELDRRDSQLALQSGRMTTQGNGKNIHIVADDIEFLSGPSQVIGSGILTIEAMQSVWSYRLGTAAENAGGASLVRDIYADTMELSSYDLAALADGFSHLTIGRAGAGNAMLIGDVMDGDRIKFTQQTRILDASFRDSTTLLADDLTIAGDVEANGNLDLQVGGDLLVQRVNIQVPDGPRDSGIEAANLRINVGGEATVSGWLVGGDLLTLEVAGGYVTVDPGAVVQTKNDNNTLLVDANGSMSIAGLVEARGAAGQPRLQTRTGELALRLGGIVSAPGDNGRVILESAKSLDIDPGTAILAGVEYDMSSGSPVAVITGQNGNIEIRSPHDMLLQGTIAASNGVMLQSGQALLDRSDYFAATFPSTHPLATRTEFGLMLAGTITTFGDNTTLDLSSEDDVIIRGNVNAMGQNSDVVIQSNKSAFVEGFVQVANGDIQLWGGIAKNGSNLNGADNRGASVTVYEASRLLAASSGNAIDIRGSRDVEISGAVTAGGQQASAGIDWDTAGDATVAITAGEQVYLNASVQASKSVTIQNGTPGADDAGLGIVMTPASGINVPGFSSSGLMDRGLVQITTGGDLEMMGAITAGAVLTQTGDDLNFDWSGTLDSDVAITSTGRAWIGGNTTDQAGNPTTAGGAVRAKNSITIQGTQHIDGVSVQVHPNSVIATYSPDSSILINSPQKTEIRGFVVAGGEINGTNVNLFDGTATLTLNSGEQAGISREFSASKQVKVLVGNRMTITDQGEGSSSILVFGTAAIRTRADQGDVTLSGPQGVEVFAPIVVDTYNIDSSGVGSTLNINFGGQAILGGRLRTYSSFNINPINPFGSSSIEVTDTGLLETINGSLIFDDSSGVLIRGGLKAGGVGSDVQITSAQPIDLWGDLSAGDEIRLISNQQITLRGDALAQNGVTISAGANSTAGQPSVSIGAGVVWSQADGSTVSISGPRDITIEGVVRAGAEASGTVDVEAISGRVQVGAERGRLEAGSTIKVAAPMIDFQGVLKTHADDGVAGTTHVQLLAGNQLTISGEVDAAGSLSATAAQSIELSGTMISGGDATVSTEDLVIGSGALLATSGDSATLAITTTYFDLAGGLYAGWDVSDAGQLAPAGNNAALNISVEEMLTIGRYQVDSEGQLVEQPGRIRSTGDLVIQVMGGTTAVGVNMATPNSSITSEGANIDGASEPVPSRVEISSDRDILLAGQVMNLTQGGDTTLTSGSLLKIDGTVFGDDQLSLHGGNDVSELSILVSSDLLTGEGGAITITGTQRILLDGNVGQYAVQPGVVQAATASVQITTSAGVEQRGDVLANDLVRIRASEFNLYSGASVVATASESLIDLRVTGNALFAEQTEFVAQGSVYFFGQQLHLAGIVAIDSSTGLLQLNAVESIVVTGGVQSAGNVRLYAGVSTTWTDAELDRDLVSADMTGGSVLVRGDGQLFAGGVLRIATGDDLVVQSNAEIRGVRREPPTPVIAYVSETIDVVIGYRQVADGTILTPVTRWIETTGEVQTGVEYVRTGESFKTLDATLTQDGYYNGSDKREYFIQGIDYANSLEDVTYPAFGVEADQRQPRNLVVDGQFTHTARSGDWSNFDAGDSFGNWHVTTGRVSLITGHFMASPQGGRSVALQESGSFGQWLRTNPGDTYTLRFVTSLHGGSPLERPTIRVLTGEKTSELTLSVRSTHSHFAMDWTEQTIEFTATSDQTWLEFKDYLGRQGVIADVSVINNNPIAVDRVNLIADGKFANSLLDGQPFRTHNAGQVVGSWQLDTDRASWVSSFWQDPPQGGRSVDLYGGISQRVATVPGRTYELSFYSTVHSRLSPKQSNLTVSISGTNYPLTITAPANQSTSNMFWTQQKLVFTATQSETLLRFSTTRNAVIGDVSLYDLDPATAPIINLIQDGSFKEPGTGPALRTVNSGDSLGPWLVTSGSIDWKAGTSGYQLAPSGGGFVDMDGQGPGAISQTFATVPGQTYDVNFKLGGNAASWLFTPRSIRVSAGDRTQDFASTRALGSTPGGLKWQDETFTFTAIGVMTTLEFRSIGTAASSVFGAALADVVVVPSSVTMAGRADGRGVDLREAGSMTYDFSRTPIQNRDGGDFNIYAVADSDGAEFDLVRVAVSANGVDFFDISSTISAPITIAGAGEVDANFARSYDINAAQLSSVKYVRVTSTRAPLSSLNPVAAYSFENGYDSDVAGGPALSVTSAVTRGNFASFNTERKVLFFPPVDANSATPPVSLPSIPEVATTREFSFAAWVRFDPGAGNRAWERIFDFGGSDANNNVLLSRFGTSNTLRLDVMRGSNLLGNIDVPDALLNITGQWHHYAVTISQTGFAQLFIDGKVAGTRLFSNIPDYSTWDENYIGASNWTVDKRFQGAMDDVAIFSRVLTATEIQQMISGFELDAVGTVLVNPYNAPIVDWAGDAPAPGSTFGQLTQMQRDRVLDQLGYQPLYNFSYTNAQENRIENGSSTLLPWTPSWANNETHITKLPISGIEGIYI